MTNALVALEHDPEKSLPSDSIRGWEPVFRKDHAQIEILAPSDEPRTAPQPTRRPNADFIAHLIATKAQAPQTRVRRRAEPEQAVAAYGSVGHWPTPLGRALSRSL
jgi:hypothetical protein